MSEEGDRYKTFFIYGFCVPFHLSSTLPLSPHCLGQLLFRETEGGGSAADLRFQLLFRINEKTRVDKSLRLELTFGGLTVREVSVLYTRLRKLSETCLSLYYSYFSRNGYGPSLHLYVWLKPPFTD